MIFLKKYITLTLFSPGCHSPACRHLHGCARDRYLPDSHRDRGGRCLGSPLQSRSPDPWLPLVLTGSMLWLRTASIKTVHSSELFQILSSSLESQAIRKTTKSGCTTVSWTTQSWEATQEAPSALPPTAPTQEQARCLSTLPTTPAWTPTILLPSAKWWAEWRWLRRCSTQHWGTGAASTRTSTRSLATPGSGRSIQESTSSPRHTPGIRKRNSRWHSNQSQP